MLIYSVKKAAEIIATMLVVSFVVYLALEVNVGDVAVKVLGPYSTVAQRQSWLAEHGYNAPFLLRYLRWLGHFVTGDWGVSTHFQEQVIKLVPPRLAATGILGGIALLVMVPLSFTMGVVAGVFEGSWIDRVISFIAVLTTSIPDFASAVFVSAIFVYGLNLLPGASSMINGFEVKQVVLPVLVISFYSIGYIARITRASMAEVMTSHYVRTALMKGASPARIVFRHALRNALIAPVTVVMLQVPWLLSGVIVSEVFFAYKGFGSLLYDAALYSDVYLIEACAMVGVVVVVVTQLISDIAYTALNPRISFSTPRSGS